MRELTSSEGSGRDEERRAIGTRTAATSAITRKAHEEPEPGRHLDGAAGDQEDREDVLREVGRPDEPPEGDQVEADRVPA